MPPKEAPKKKGNSKARERRRLQKLQEQAIRESKGHVETGMNFMDKANYVKAITAFNQAIEQWAENVDAYLLRGRAYKELKDYDKAVNDFSKAIEKNPNDPQGYAGRGNAYESIEDYDKAIDDYTSVIELVPDDDHAYNMRGNARQAKRITSLKLSNAEFASVISDFTKAIEINPYNYYAYSNRAHAFYDRKEFKDAIEDYTQALNVKHDYLYAYLRRGISYHEVVLFDEHQTALKQKEQEMEEPELTKLPKVSQMVTKNQQAMWEAEFKEIEEQERKEKDRLMCLQNAIADFTKVIQLDENEAQGYHHRMKVYTMLGEDELAKEDKNKLAQLQK